MSAKTLCFFVLIVLLSLFPFRLLAQTVGSQKQEEAPETVFQTKIGDAEVDLKLEGFWDASLQGSLGAAFVPGKGVQYPSVFPGFPDGLIYDQKPNLLLSLWLMERYFFETSLQEKRELNTYVLGYQGKEGELLQSLRAGNAGIEISPYPYMDFPGGSRSSPGIAARLQTSRAQYEFLLRYDPSLPAKRTYVGKNLVEEVRIPPSRYTQGQYFYLPDEEVDTLEVYLEDAQGSLLGDDGRRYRKATDFDASLSRTEGTVSLQKSWPGRVLAYYEKAGQSVGSASLGKKALPSFVKSSPGSPWMVDPLAEGEDFSWFRSDYLGAPISRFKVTVGGKEALLLHDPGTYSPFQNYGVYALENVNPGTNTRIRIVKKSGDLPFPLSYPVQPVVSSTPPVLRFSQLEEDPKAFTSRYPFAKEAPLLYGPDSIKAGGGTEFEILIQTYTPIQTYSVPADTLPGSVRMFVNGKELDFFTVNYETGAVSLPFDPSPSDRIEIYFRTASGQGAGGDILLGMGSTIQFSDALTAKLSLGARWNVLKGNYSAEPTDHPGTIGGSAQLSYQTENFRLLANGATFYFNSDTTGYLRLLSMEDYDLTLELSKYNAVPSSIPDPTFFGGSLTQQNRGRLFFKNFESVDLLGGTILNLYTWDSPTIFPYQTGSLPGPYIASASPEGFNRVLVLDFDMNASEEWVGAQLYLNTGFDPSLDLSEVTAIRFAYKVVSHSGTDSRLYFQVGALDEDLDSDGVLDEEISASSRGFAFNQRDWVLYVGAGQEGLGNDRRDSEDANRNNILDRENSNLVFPGPGATEGNYSINTSEAGDWKIAFIRVPYTERNRLKATRAVRFIVKKEAGGDSTGKILIGPIVYEGTTLPHRVEGQGEVEVREIAENLSEIPPTEYLEKVDPDPISRFHSEGKEQKVLEVKWKNLSAGSKWVVFSPTTEVPAEQYEEVNLYLRRASVLGTSPDAKLTFQYTDSEGRGARVDIPLEEANQWQKLTINLARKKAYLGQVELPASTVQVDSNFGKLNRFVFSSSGSTEGVLYLDELHLSRPQTGWGFAGALYTSFTLPGTVLEIGGFPVLRNLNVSEKLFARTQNFQGRLEQETASSFSSSSEGSVDLFFLLRTEVSFALDQIPTQGTRYEGGHRLKIPAEGGVFQIQDQFKRTYHWDIDTFSRGNRLEVAFGPPLGLGLSSEASLTSDKTLTQTWESYLSTTPYNPFSSRINLKLAHSAQGYEFLEEPYLSSWRRSYHLLFPYTEGFRIQREGNLKWESTFSGERVSLRLLPELSYLNTGELNGQQRSSQSLTVEVPIRLSPMGAPETSITFSYFRQGTDVRNVQQFGNFPSDFTTLQKAIREQVYFYQSVPFYELFSPGRWSTFTQDTLGLFSAEYNARFGLSFSRPFGSYWQDLVVPSQGEAGLKKLLTRNQDSITTTNQLDLALQQSALNLFGKGGAYPATSLWVTDEYQIKHTFFLLWQEEAAKQEWKVSSQQKANLLGEQDQKLSLDHLLNLQQSQDFFYWGSLTLSFSWRTPLLRDFGIPALARARDQGAYYQHTEKVEFRYEDKEGWKSYLVMGHETALTFPKYGYIKAELALGIGWEKDYSGLPPGYRFLIGLRGGIFAYFTF
ncbi:MAG: hypothetical protein SNJ78_04460 [Spirochaetales bacterium]